jgi:hypothetical protein
LDGAGWQAQPGSPNALSDVGAASATPARYYQGMSDDPKTQFGLRALFWSVTQIGRWMTLVSPSASLMAGFVITFFVLLVLEQLIARV